MGVDGLKGDMLSFELARRSETILQGLVGCQAPDFRVKTLDGKEYTLSSLRGKVVVLNFWFTTCEPCRYELPGLNRLVKEYANQGVHFLALARNTEDEVVQFLSRHSFDYGHAVDSDELRMKFCVLGGWPMSMVIDRTGVLRFVKTGGPVPPNGDPLLPYLEIKPVLDKYILQKP